MVMLAVESRCDVWRCSGPTGLVGPGPCRTSLVGPEIRIRRVRVRLYLVAALGVELCPDLVVEEPQPVDPPELSVHNERRAGDGGPNLQGAQPPHQQDQSDQ